MGGKEGKRGGGTEGLREMEGGREEESLREIGEGWGKRASECMREILRIKGDAL